MMNILMASSECLPFSKTGGLSDVVYSLSKEIAKLKNEVSIVTPYYSSINSEKFDLKPLLEFKVKMNWRVINTEVFTTKIDGITFYLIKNDYYFSRNNGLYGYFDDGERFAYFSNAVIVLMKELNIKFDILHVHDWQTAMIPCILRKKPEFYGVFDKLKTVLTIHNPLFKGYFNHESLYDFYGLGDDLYYSGKVRLEGQVSTLKAGISFSDKITTVSPNHVQELLTPETSFGLSYDLELRRDDFVGILNGIDYGEFDPKNDGYIYKKFAPAAVLNGKKANKEGFNAENNLEPGRPLYGIVSRLSDQKGIDLLMFMSNYILDMGGNIAIVGSGEKFAEDYFDNLVRRYPTRVSVYIGYNNEVAHKIYAASDFFLMPSVFEPCGISQMIAHRYGSLPVVRSTGGLKDTVMPYYKDRGNEKEADGFVFEDYDTNAARWAIDETLFVYYDRKDVMDILVKNAVAVDHKWEKSAKKYLDLYKNI